jgi:hypothetical protein
MAGQLDKEQIIKGLERQAKMGQKKLSKMQDLSLMNCDSQELEQQDRDLKDVDGYKPMAPQREKAEERINSERSKTGESMDDYKKRASEEYQQGMGQSDDAKKMIDDVKKGGSSPESLKKADDYLKKQESTPPPTAPEQKTTSQQPEKKDQSPQTSKKDRKQANEYAKQARDKDRKAKIGEEQLKRKDRTKEQAQKADKDDPNSNGKNMKDWKDFDELKKLDKATNSNIKNDSDWTKHKQKEVKDAKNKAKELRDKEKALRNKKTKPTENSSAPTTTERQKETPNNEIKSHREPKDNNQAGADQQEWKRQLRDQQLQKQRAKNQDNGQGLNFTKEEDEEEEEMQGQMNGFPKPQGISKLKMGPEAPSGGETDPATKKEQDIKKKLKKQMGGADGQPPTNRGVTKEPTKRFAKSPGGDSLGDKDHKKAMAGKTDRQSAIDNQFQDSMKEKSGKKSKGGGIKEKLKGMMEQRTAQRSVQQQQRESQQQQPQQKDSGEAMGFGKKGGTSPTSGVGGKGIGGMKGGMMQTLMRIPQGKACTPIGCNATIWRLALDYFAASIAYIVSDMMIKEKWTDRCFCCLTCCSCIQQLIMLLLPLAIPILIILMAGLALSKIFS